MYVKDGVALYVTGMGKVNSAMSLQAILSDSRFDFSDAYVFSTGCAGSAIEYGVMGDVYVTLLPLTMILVIMQIPVNLPTSPMPPGIMMIPMTALPIRF